MFRRREKNFPLKAPKTFQHLLIFNSIGSFKYCSDNHLIPRLALSFIPSSGIKLDGGNSSFPSRCRCWFLSLYHLPLRQPQPNDIKCCLDTLSPVVYVKGDKIASI